MDNTKVSKQYLQFRQQVLQYTNMDMNLKLENEELCAIPVYLEKIKDNIDEYINIE